MNRGVVFPGQGSQRIGMGRDFYDKFPVAKDRFEEASEAIQIDIQKLCFEENDEINQTEYTQPALLTVEIAMYQAIEKEYDFIGDYFAGHSLGEYTALVVAKVIPFSDAVKIVHKRGLLMQSAMGAQGEEGGGGMAALVCENIEETNYRDIVAQTGAELANLNSKNQVIITGLKQDIENAGVQLKESVKGLDVIPLNIRTPFHSSFMRVIEKEFEDYLHQFSKDFNPIHSKKVLSNFTGKFYEENQVILNLVKQVSGSVNWISNMKQMLERCEQIYEIGSKRILGKFFATMGEEIRSIIHIKSLERALS